MFEFVANSERQGLQDYRKVIAELSLPGEGTFQRSAGVVELYQDAARTDAAFGKLVREMAAAVGGEIQVMHTPGKLKHTARILEKRQGASIDRAAKKA